MRRLLCAFILLISALPACAQIPFSLIVSEQLRSTFTLVGSGARAAGMGEAFTAVADDATAASFNPAGLAQLVIPEASVVFDHIHVEDKYSDFVIFSPDEPPLPLTDSEAHFDRNELNFLSITLPFLVRNRRCAVQFSTQEAVDVTYSGDREFSELDAESNPIVFIHQKSDQSGGIRIYSGSFAISASKKMLLGVTLNRWTGDWTFVGFSSETPVDSSQDREYLNYKQTNDLSGWNFDLGVLLRYKYANVGVRYRSPFSPEYNFLAKVDTNIQEDVLPLPETSTQLEWPSTLNLGVAWKPSNRLTIAADYSRTNWSKMAFRVAGSGKVNFFDLRLLDETKVGIANDWRVGTEYLFFWKSAVLPVRAGWSYEPQPNLDIGTGNRLVTRALTAGAGIKIHSFTMDFAYQRKTSSTSVALYEPDDVVIGDFTNRSIGRLHRNENRFFISLILQVPRDSFLRPVFVD